MPICRYVHQVINIQFKVRKEVVGSVKKENINRTVSWEERVKAPTSAQAIATAWCGTSSTEKIRFHLSTWRITPPGKPPRHHSPYHLCRFCRHPHLFHCRRLQRFYRFCCRCRFCRCSRFCRRCRSCRRRHRYRRRHRLHRRRHHRFSSLRFHHSHSYRLQLCLSGLVCCFTAAQP